MFSRRTNWNLAKNRYSEAIERYRASGRPLLDLTASNPTQVGLEVFKNANMLAVLSNPESLTYHPEPQGLLTAREAVCRYYRERGENVGPEQVVLTTSTSEAYSFALRLLCDPGDEILVPVPSYPLFEFLADLHDVRLVPYPLFYDHGWHIDLATLQQRAGERTRAIVLVHPNNPTGSFVKAAEVQELNALCAERGLALIVDEVFLDFAHSERAGLSPQPGAAGATSASVMPSFVSNDTALTFTLSGLSKISGLPQMKFAWIATSGPEAIAREALSRLEVIADTYLSMNAPVQLAAPAFFGVRHEFQQELNQRVATNLSELDRQLASQSLCSRLEVEAGWYAVLRVPATGSDEELAIRLLENEGVLVHPGHFYDFPSEGYLVVSLIAREEEFQEGVRRLLGSLI
jgi:aspartate/methionine/tyrosine aminotransferase